MTGLKLTLVYESHTLKEGVTALGVLLNDISQTFRILIESSFMSNVDIDFNLLDAIAVFIFISKFYAVIKSTCLLLLITLSDKIEVMEKIIGTITLVEESFIGLFSHFPSLFLF